jgi:hypothetical protein
MVGAGTARRGERIIEVAGGVRERSPLAMEEEGKKR